MSTMSDLDAERQERGQTIPEFYARHGWELPAAIATEEQELLDEEAYE